jgi:hypothetical protein
MPLSDRDLAILQFEQHWATRTGNKAAAIRSELDLSPSRYYAARDALTDSDEALAHDPLLVRRLRRSRTEARRRRFEGHRAGHPTGTTREPQR